MTGVIESERTIGGISVHKNLRQAVNVNGILATDSPRSSGTQARKYGFAYVPKEVKSVVNANTDANVNATKNISKTLVLHKGNDK